MRFRRVYRDPPEPRLERDEAPGSAQAYGLRLDVSRLMRENQLLREAVQEHAGRAAALDQEVRVLRLALVSHDFDQAPR